MNLLKFFHFRGTLLSYLHEPSHKPQRLAVRKPDPTSWMLAARVAPSAVRRALPAREPDALTGQ